MLDKSPRLRFTEEELEDRQVRRAAGRAEQAAGKADAAKSKLRTDADRAKARAEKLRFGKKDNSEPANKPGTGFKKPPPGRAGTRNTADGKPEKTARSRLRFDGSASEVKPPGNRFRPAHAVGGTASAQLHHQVSAQNEDENAGVQAAHQGEEMAESTAHTVEHAGYSKKLKAYDKAAKLERRADKTNVEALYQQKKTENPELSSNPLLL